VVNVPTAEYTKEVMMCGTTSGRVVDKFKETGLTALPARKVEQPIIKECVSHLECRLVNEISTGDQE